MVNTEVEADILTPEENLLGMILNNAENLEKCLQIDLKAEHLPKYGYIFEELRKRFCNSEPHKIGRAHV